MDPAQLAQMIAYLISPFLPEFLSRSETLLEEAETGLVPTVRDRARGLWQRLNPSVEASPGTQSAARLLAERPEDPRAKAALELHLEEILQKDAALADEIARLVGPDEATATAAERDAATRIAAVDAWAQPALRGLFEHVPEIARLFVQSGSEAVLETGVTPEQMLEAMDAAGIERVLLSAWHRPGRWIVSNDEVARFVRLYPSRFSGVAAVDLEHPLDAVRELDRAVTELGFVALRVVPWLWNRPPNDKLYYPLFVKCIELDIPFCTQVGHTGPLMPSEPGRPIPYLDEVALTFPELRIVGGHIGYPWTDEMIALAWKHENVYIDTSAHLPRYYPRQLLHFLKTYGREKVLFATNFPQLSLEKCAAQTRALDLPPDVVEAFLRGNARRVFKLAAAV